MPAIQNTPLSRRFSRRAAKLLRARPVAMLNKRAIVSFTFDDCPRTAVKDGAAILERHGAAGTFYVSGGLAGMMWENGPQFCSGDLPPLVAAGHEVGCHTFSHPDCAAMTSKEIRRELNANQSFLAASLPGTEITSFAYPYGSASMTAKLAASGRFLACRGVEDGINAGVADFGLLNAVGLPRDTLDPAWIAQWIQRAIDARGWLVFYTHDISADPSAYGCRSEVLEAAVKAVRRAGLDIMTIGDAARAISGSCPADATAPKQVRA